MRAAIDRVENGTGTIRVLHDPKKRTTFFNDNGKMSVTGNEMQVMLSRGYAPDPNTGVVKRLDEMNVDPQTQEIWDEVRDFVNEFDVSEVDQSALNKYTNTSEFPYGRRNEINNSNGG